MPGPNITVAEQESIDLVLNIIQDAQNQQEESRKALSTQELTDLGVPQSIVDKAIALGFNGKVEQYSSPYGFGWTFTIILERDGIRWVRTFHRGPPEENWRELDWLNTSSKRVEI